MESGLRSPRRQRQETRKRRNSVDFSDRGSKRGRKAVCRRGSDKAVDGIKVPSATELYGQVRTDWQEKCLLIIDEVSILGARTLYAVNKQLCKLRGCAEDFGGIPIVLFYNDFHQFHPVQERSILLPSIAIPWDDDKSFRTEQGRQHNRAHAL